MGVPTVAMPGEIFASRHSMSHLCNVGLSDWVAPDLDAYIELKMGEVYAFEHTPHPIEFKMYYSV
jgi:predicted O-linked N-acetylglucosamine transferase (SPINDLY family)